MFEFKLKTDLSLSPCLQMILSQPVSALLPRNLSPDKCKQVLRDTFDGLFLIVFYCL